MRTILIKTIFSIFIYATILSCKGAQTHFSTLENVIHSTAEINFNNKVDILFVIDSSASMSQYRHRLSDNINSFIVKLNELGFDYQIAITNMDMDDSNYSCSPYSRQIVGYPSYLTADNIHLLKPRMLQLSSSCPVTKGLDSMAHAISKDYLSSIGSDFIRDKAYLHVIFISDEDDSSTEFGHPDLADFIDILDSRKPKVPGYLRGWTAHFVGYLSEFSTCDILGVLPEVGDSYIKLVNVSGGLSLPLCNSNLYEILRGLSKKIVQTSRTIKFSQPPREDSIRVYVGEIFIQRSLENGWDLEYKKDENGRTTVYLIFNGPATPKSEESAKIYFDAKAGT